MKSGTTDTIEAIEDRGQEDPNQYTIDTNFRLNDRQNSNQLSDKIIDSGQQIFEVILSDDGVQQILMKGEMTEANTARAHRRLIDATQFVANLGHIFGNLKNLTEDQNERQFFDMCSDGLRGQITEYTKRLEQMIGKIDQKLLDSPMSQPMYNIHTFHSYITDKGPILRGLVPILASEMLFPRVMAYLKQNSSYVDNELTKMLLFDDVDVSPLIEQLRRMIDSRADQVSEEEVDVLCELFRRDLVYEMHIQKHEFNQMKWFEI